MTELDTADAVAAFIRSAQARKLAPKSVEKHRYHLDFLERATRTLPTTTEELEHFLIDHYAQLRADGRGPLSDSTTAKTWASLHDLYAWLTERQDWQRNPMAPIPKPRVRPTLPKVLTQDETDRLLDTNERRDPRAFALIAIALDTMARLGELAPLTWDHIKTNGDGAEVHFPRTGKQGARSAPINPDTLTALKRACPQHALWTKVDGEPLSYLGVQTWTRRTLARAGINAGPHILRHTGATLFVINGGNLFTLMRIGGWSTLASVQVYVHLANSDIRHQHQKFSTIARRSAQGGTQLRLLQEAN